MVNKKGESYFPVYINAHKTLIDKLNFLSN